MTWDLKRPVPPEIERIIRDGLAAGTPEWEIRDQAGLTRYGMRLARALLGCPIRRGRARLKEPEHAPSPLPFTRRELRAIREDLAAGKSIKALSDEMQVPRGKIRRACIKMGIPVPDEEMRAISSSPQAEAAIELLKTVGKVATNTEIGRQAGLSRERVRQLRAALQLPKSDRPAGRPKKDYSHEPWFPLLGVVSDMEIGRRFGFSVGVPALARKRHGIQAAIPPETASDRILANITDVWESPGEIIAGLENVGSNPCQTLSKLYFRGLVERKVYTTTKSGAPRYAYRKISPKEPS